MSSPNYKDDFADFTSACWLNAGGEGPLLNVAAEVLQEAIRWKSLPFELTDQRFAQVPVELKTSIGKLLNVNYRDVILGNSASYGLHLLANGYPWSEGDEILLMQNDFPTDIIPWLALEEKGVKVKQIKTKGRVLTPEELRANITPKTKLFCISHVHTFSGIILDVEEFAKICKERDVAFVLNLSQTLGCMPFDVSKLDIDAVVCAGYKWLCGPYGTGFAWIKPELREKLQYNQAYWTAFCSPQELQSEGALVHKDIKSARKYDVFGTANFFNFVPLRSAIDYWLDKGMENVWVYNNELIDQLIAGLKAQEFTLISPERGKARSGLVVFSHQDPAQNKAIFERLKSRNIHPTLWKNNIRVSAHVYNTERDINCLLEELGGT